MTTPLPAWTYRARLVRAIDGDTCVLVIDAGFFVAVTAHLRLDGINSPELHAPDPAPGRAAAAFTAAWFAAATGDWPLVVVTRKANTQEKYGRFLATVSRASDGACLNSALLDSGHAVPYSGGKR